MDEFPRTFESERPASNCKPPDATRDNPEGDNVDEAATPKSRKEEVENRIDAEPRLSFALRRLLAHCQSPRALEDIDETVASWPEMKASSFTARTLLSWMVAAGGIEELGDTAAAVFQTTEAGNLALENYRESNPLESLFEEYPSYERGFLKVLDACKSPRSRKDIDLAFEGDPLLEEPKRIYPNFFTDKLERSGGLIWNAGWETTAEGLSFLRERGA